jgi:helix-turn-helix protein
MRDETETSASGSPASASSTVNFWEIVRYFMETGEQSSGWLTANEAAQYLKVKPRSLLLWVRQGKVKAYAFPAPSGDCGGSALRIWIPPSLAAW